MKKLVLLAALVIMGTAAWAAAPVATVSLNNFDANNPIFYLKSGTGAGPGQHIQILGGPVGGALAPLKTPAGADTFEFLGDGFFDAGAVGVVPGVAAGGNAEFQVKAWDGATFASSANQLLSKTWTQATKSEDVEPPALPVGIALNVPAGLVIAGVVPEPSTIALGLLGAAALLIRRRK